MRTVLLGTIGTVLVLLGSIGAGGTLVHDPILGSGPLSAFRYGHGKYLASAVVYLGFGLLVWAWVRLGRGVLAAQVGSRSVLLAAAAWIAPLLIAPPLFTRDVYSYLAQGLLALHGFDPYSVGPSALTGPIPDNVHPFWQTTPAPYGPLFIGLSKGVVLLAGGNVIAGVILMRLLLLVGLAMLIHALPGLVRYLGGNLPVALWLAVAGPLTVVHLVGGPHNDLLMIGLLALGTLLALQGRHASGIALVTLAMAIKATAGLVLPFLVWVWASRLSGPRLHRFVKAVVPAVLLYGAVFGACTALAEVGMGWLHGLSAPSLITTYTSVPTGLGQLLHSTTEAFLDVNAGVFIGVCRTLGGLALVVLLLWQWWQARDGGADAVQRAALVLFAGAMLAPTMFPWYLSWSMALAAALPWTRRTLSVAAGASVVLVLAYYPDGETGLYHWPSMAAAVGFALLAAVSLIRFDPLGLGETFGGNHSHGAAIRSGTNGR
ncbi:alpha-1,6-mannosyltransferase [Haloactinomyces albus]|uniref:Alpha-1,6-mannosyltransferase n=1 Tax=Haloactinomyces albus TaxID=1352928 RepID=A0AAE3ZFQ4_9ACTN|nr:alpha-1,6-mannosyltransferase [Haloactinomyces albus]